MRNEIIFCDVDSVEDILELLEKCIETGSIISDIIYDKDLRAWTMIFVNN